MKKLFLSAFIVISAISAASAGSCAIGTADLKYLGGGKAVLTCPGNGTCFETDHNDPKDIKPGDHIQIHISGHIVDAVVLSAPISSSNPQQINGVTYYDISGSIIVKP